MVVRSFTHNPALGEAFVRFPYEFYRHDCRYVAPQISEQLEFLEPDGLVYRGTAIEARHFLVMTAQSVVGRVSAFANPALHDTDGTPVGAVGLFECVEDYSVAEALLSHATTWLHSNYGLTHIWGPMNGDIWHGYRFMTRGFEDETFVGEPHNPAYYSDFFERFGFAVKREWDSLIVDGPDRIRQMIARGEGRLNLLLKQGYRFDTWRESEREKQLSDLQEVLSASFSGFLGYTPVSREQFNQFFEHFRPVLDPDLFLLTYDPQDRCVGFAIAFPDMVKGVRAMRGKNTLPARAAYLVHRDTHPRLNFYVGGITPEQESKRTGLGRAGFYVLLNRALEKGYTTVMLTLRLKGNEAHGLAARCGVVPQHEYALYEYCHED